MVFVVLLAIDHLDIGGDLIQQTFLILLAGVVLRAGAGLRPRRARPRRRADRTLVPARRAPPDDEACADGPTTSRIDTPVAGPALSARRHLGRQGRQLRAVLRACRAGRAVPVRRHRPHTRCSASSCASRPTRSGTATCRRRGPGSSTATASTARTNRRQGHRFNGHKLLLDPYARNIVGKLRWHDALFGYRIGHGEATCPSTAATARPHAALQGHRDGLHLGRRPPAQRALARDRDLRDCMCAASRCATRTCRRTLRGTYAGLACAPVIDYLKRLGVTTVELMPVHAFVDDRHLVERGLRNYWGYNTIGFFAPEHRYSASGKVNEFKTMVRTLHAAGIEVILDVVYNHTAEGNELGPDAVASAASTTRPTTAWCRDDAALLRGLHRLRQHAEHAAPARAAAADGLAALLGHRDARRRLPLRPGLGAGARAARGRPPQRLLRRPAPGPGAVAGQADRRALGPGLGRLPGRQLPGRLGRVERQVPRHDARLLEGRRRPDRRVRAAPDRLQRPVQPQQPPALRQHQLRHRARRLHAWPTWSPTTTSTTRPTARTTATATTTTCRGTAASRARPTTPACCALRARQQRNFLATLLLSQGVPMLLAGDEIGRSQQGNNNAYCQDNAISWVDWTPTSDRAVAAGLHAAHDRAARARTRCSGAATSSRAGRCMAASVRDIVWLQPDGIGDDATRTGTTTMRARWPCSSRATALTEVDGRGRAVRDDSFLLLFNADAEPR